jgi:hypothetical protein
MANRGPFELADQSPISGVLPREFHVRQSAETVKLREQQ